MANTKETPVVKAEVTKVKRKKRFSKGALYPWEVRSVYAGDFCKKEDKGFHEEIEEFSTRKKAEEFIKKNPDLIAPVLIHIVIPLMEY